MPFGQFAHFCGGINPAVPRISRPLIRRPAALIALGAAFRGHLAAQQHRHPDKEGHAHYQRRSQRGEIGPHGGLLSADLLKSFSRAFPRPFLPTLARPFLPTRALRFLLAFPLAFPRAEPDGGTAGLVSSATQRRCSIVSGPVTTATACGCCPVCWALPTPGRETPPLPRHRSAKAPCTPLPPREYH